jgi:hypothetical protein
MSKSLLAFLGAWAGAWLGQAAHAQTGVIYGCVSSSAGDIRIVASAALCKKGESLLSWNQTGPSGPPGPQGAAGPAGPQGPQGPAGATSPLTIVLRHASRTVQLAPNEGADIASICLDGETAVGGGPSVIPASVSIAWSTVVFDGGPRSGWQVNFVNATPDTIVVTPRTSALCAPGTMTLGG